MAIKFYDDIDELFSELKNEPNVKAPKPKPEYIELKLSEYALCGPFGHWKVIRTISTAQLDYDERASVYLVNCAPFQPFVTNVICAKSVDVFPQLKVDLFPQLKIALKSATTNKIAIMHVSGIEVIKDAANMTNLVSIDFVLDKEHNDNVVNSTGIRMKMNVLVGPCEMGNPFVFEKRRDTIKYTHDPYVGWVALSLLPTATFAVQPKVTSPNSAKMQ